MAIVIVDGQEIEIGDGERLNGIQAAQRAGIEIPHYCWHPGLTVVASCRMCLVETGRRDPASGAISMMPKLVPACQTPARDGTVFVTNSQQVTDARAMVEEDLLIRHPIDCPICDKAGECHLQDYHFQHGREQRRADIKPFTSRRRPLGDSVTLFVDRCVMCSRCVRFCREIPGTSELMVTNRGAHEEIDVFPGFPLANKMAGNVVDLCPVGALGDRDFLYSQRVWFMQNHDQICAGCSTGCSIHVDENQDRIYRLRPRPNPHVNQWWMCDEGRYGWKHAHDERRQTAPRRRDGEQLRVEEWGELIPQLDADLRAAGRLAAVLSPHLTVEEAWLLASYIRAIDPQAWLVPGPVPVVGQDETFGGGFTIHAEKCPNRRGVQAVVSALSDELITWEQFLERAAGEGFGAVWISGGYPAAWHGESEAEQLAAIPLRIVQDIFPSPLWEQAGYQLPGAVFAEREGSYVNFDDRLQSFRWAIRPPAGVQTEGRLFWRLAGRRGMYQADEVLLEVARRVAYFAAAVQPVPEVGVDLKVLSLA
ncbi:MAG: (2Fe-2S)-binding protein [Pirellulaceae bacterium]|nr:(2Fe-2S)-binding protein [Pirellulaceae bacterium]